MQCETARRLMPFARAASGELDAADRAALDAHVSDCPDCLALSNAERDADGGLRRSMADVPVPGGLRDRLDRRLSASRSFWIRKRVVEGVAVAVALLLAIGGVYRTTRPTLDAFAIAQATYEQSGLWRPDKEAWESANAWLRRQDSRLGAPTDFDYKSWAFVGRTDFAGLSSVPMLTLVRGRATARLFFVRATAIKNPDFDPVEEGGCSVSVRRYDDLPGWLVIVVTGGGPVEQFLIPANGPA